MEGMELISFQIISSVGTARSLIMEALADARVGNYDDAAAKLEESSEHMGNAHKAHAGLIQKEAQGEKVEFSLLFMHAEDQLLTTLTLRDIATEMIEMYKKINAK